MPSNVSATYARDKWEELKVDVVSGQGCVHWTMYDVSLKALAYVIWSVPLIGTPICLTLLASSVVIDAAIYQKWPQYKKAIRTFFNGKVRPTVESAASSVQLREKIATAFSVFNRLAGG